MLIKELRGTESTQDACAKMRVSLPNIFISSCWNTKYRVWLQIATFQMTIFFICWSAESHCLYIKKVFGLCSCLYLSLSHCSVSWCLLDLWMYLCHVAFTLIFKDLKLIVCTLVILQIKRKMVFSLLQENGLSTYLPVWEYLL